MFGFVVFEFGQERTTSSAGDRDSLKGFYFLYTHQIKADEGTLDKGMQIEIADV